MSRCQIKHQLLANAVVHDEEIVFLTESYIKRSLKLEIRSKNVSLDCNVIFNIVRYSLSLSGSLSLFSSSGSYIFCNAALELL